jgi:hypothetical protein
MRMEGRGGGEVERASPGGRRGGAPPSRLPCLAPTLGARSIFLPVLVSLSSFHQLTQRSGRCGPGRRGRACAGGRRGLWERREGWDARESDWVRFFFFFPPCPARLPEWHPGAGWGAPLGPQGQAGRVRKHRPGGGVVGVARPRRARGRPHRKARERWAAGGPGKRLTRTLSLPASTPPPFFSRNPRTDAAGGQGGTGGGLHCCGRG